MLRFFFLFFLISFRLTSQDLQPSPTEALLQFKIIDKQQNPVQATLYCYAIKSKRTFSVSSEVGKILLPLEEDFILYLQNAPEQYNISTTAQAYQHYNVGLRFNPDNTRLFASPTESLVKIKIVDSKEQGISIKVALVHKATQQTYSKITDAEGKTEFVVPNNASYGINVGKTNNYRSLDLPEKPFYILNQEIQFEQELGDLQPSLDSALFNFTYLDLDEKPIAGEVFTAKSQRTKQLFNSLPTDATGKTQLKVPIGDSYTLNAKYALDFASQKVDSKPDLYVKAFTFSSVSSADWDAYYARLREEEERKEAEWQKRQAEMQRLVAQYEQEREQARQKIEQERQIALQQYKADSARLAQETQLKIQKEQTQKERLLKEMKKMDSLKRAETVGKFDPSTSEKRITETVPPVEKRLADDGFSFGLDATVIHTLKRNTQWKHKTIVIDVTASMLPYYAQFSRWYASHTEQEGKANVVFFNDGNALKTSEKMVGKTGGMYVCKACDLKNFQKTQKTALQAGGGGDSPENDIEALLYAQQAFPESTELILIADNSLIRDMELLAQLKKPVRVVACGLETGVNVQYLNLAYQTGGSFHTLHKDFELQNWAENSHLTIGKQTFVLKQGQFLPAE